tara:strand:- start:906 stop:1076 length:171 start_codon:yes stop_codon:yes gene_type:complete
MDRRAIKYYRAAESGWHARQAEIERELRADPYFCVGDLDTEYSNGKMLNGCRIERE